MIKFYVKLAPILAFFILGIIFRSIKLFDEKDGQKLLKLNFYLFLPALIFLSAYKSELEISSFYLPIAPIVPIFINLIIVYFLLKKYPQNRRTAGTLYCAAMIMNSGFTLPFFQTALGTEGFAKGVLFDIGNAFIIYTFIYFIAVLHGQEKADINRKKEITKKILIMPPFWAFFIGVALPIMNTNLNSSIEMFFEYASAPAIPIIMLSMGLFFSPIKRTDKKADNNRYFLKIFTIIFIRMGIGLLTGISLAYFLPIDRISKAVIIVNCAAPCGYNTLVFSSLENLDEKIAANIVSIAIILALFILPAILYIL
jgi:predicted permease